MARTLVAMCAVILALAGCSEGHTPRLSEVTSDTAAVAAKVAAAFHRPDPERIPSALATNPGTPWGDFVGGEACKDCHEQAYSRWRGSFHSRTLYDVDPDTVMGRFDGKPVIGGKDGKQFFEIVPFTKADELGGTRRFYMSLRWLAPDEGGVHNREQADTYGAGELPDIDVGTVEVIFAFGNRRHQPYVARWPAADGQPGTHWVLPIFWNDAEQAWRWAGFRPYVRSCAQCHVTGIANDELPHRLDQRPLSMTYPPRYNLPPTQEQWADGAVGCESCHGPGRVHVESVAAVGAEQYRSLRQSGAKAATIWDAASGDITRRMDMCGSCHNFFTESFVTWQPRPHGFERDAVRQPLKPSPQSVGWQFYEDGSHMSPCTVVEVFRGSKLFEEEEIECTECHDPHGTENWADLKRPLLDNALCLDCHEEYEGLDAQTGHSKHNPDSAGNVCAECHMPRHMAFSNGVHVMSDQIYSHAFSVPTGRRKAGGPPPSCNVCHTDRDDAWTRAEIERLWGQSAGGATDAVASWP